MDATARVRVAGRLLPAIGLSNARLLMNELLRGGVRAELVTMPRAYTTPDDVVAGAVRDAAELQAERNRSPQHLFRAKQSADADYEAAHAEFGAPEGGVVPVPPRQPQADDLIRFMGIAADLDSEE